jgi:hypothetical protein
MGDVTGGLAGKRARISGTDSLRGGEIIIKAQVPLAEVSDYQTELKAMTGGQGRYAIEFSHYEPVPPQVQKQLTDAYKPKAIIATKSRPAAPDSSAKCSCASNPCRAAQVSSSSMKSKAARFPTSSSRRSKKACGRCSNTARSPATRCRMCA